jgi:hypothetical protein
MPSLGSIDRFMFGIALQQGLALTAEVHSRTTEDAAKLTALLSMMEAGLKAQNKDGGTTVDVQQENGTFRVSVTVPEAVIRKAITDQKTAIVAAFSGMGANGGPREGGQTAAPNAVELAPAMSTSTAPVVAPAPTNTVLISPRPASVAAPRSQSQVTKSPNGDTMILRLPGAK